MERIEKKKLTHLFWKPALPTAPSSSQNISVNSVCLFVFMSNYNWHETLNRFASACGQGTRVFSLQFKCTKLSYFIFTVQTFVFRQNWVPMLIYIKSYPQKMRLWRRLEILKIWHFKVNVCLLPWILSLNDLFNDFSKRETSLRFLGIIIVRKQTVNISYSRLWRLILCGFTCICFVLLLIYFCV